MAKQKTKSEAKTYRDRLRAGEVSYRETSDKAAIFRAFCSGGPEAAAKEAKKRKKSDASFRAWLADWNFLQRIGGPSPLAGVSIPKAAPKATSKKATIKRKSTKTAKAA